MIMITASDNQINGRVNSCKRINGHSEENI